MRTDFELIALVLADDDRHAFGELIERHQMMVRGFFRKATGGDGSLADDLAQETFVRAYRGLASYRGGAQFSSWLYGIAINLFLSEARRQSDVKVELPAAETRSPADQLILRHDLERALAQLRVEERTAITLTLREELTHSEAAALMQWPLGTLKTHVSRGKRKLRELLTVRTIWQET